MRGVQSGFGLSGGNLSPRCLLEWSASEQSECVLEDKHEKNHREEEAHVGYGRACVRCLSKVGLRESEPGEGSTTAYVPPRALTGRRRARYCNAVSKSGSIVMLNGRHEDGDASGR